MAAGQGYSFLWWTRVRPDTTDVFHGSYAAEGAFGQYILVVPKLDTVVAHKVVARGGPSMNRSVRTLAWEAARNLGPLGDTDRTEFCPVVSPDGGYVYLTSDRRFADKPLKAALSTRGWNARLDGPGHALGDSWRVRMSAVFEALGPTPR